MLLAVNRGVVATPLELVVVVNEEPPPENVPLAPVVGAVNVTLTPGIKALFVSRTVAWSTTGKPAPGAVLWGVPALGTILEGKSIFVRLYDATGTFPPTLAVTV